MSSRSSAQATSSTTYRMPPGDPGLFGPDSVAWVILPHLPAMLIGGIDA